MDTVKDQIDNLSEADRRLLNYAFESGDAQYIELANGQYVGVYADRIGYLIPEQEAGKWSVGKIKEGHRKLK